MPLLKIESHGKHKWKSYVLSGTNRTSDDDNIQKLRIYKIRAKIHSNHTLLYNFFYSFVLVFFSNPQKTSKLRFLSKHPCKFNIAQPYRSQPVQFFFSIFTLTWRLKAVNFSFRPTLSSEQSLKTLFQDSEEIHSLNEKIFRFLIKLPLTSLSLEHLVRKVSELQTFPKQWQLRMKDLYNFTVMKILHILKNFFYQ